MTSRADRKWPTRRGRRRPLDVVAAQEELCLRLRERFLDALEADPAEPSSGGDAIKCFGVYSKSLDGLIKLQFDLGHLERVAPGRWSPAESGPVARPMPDFTKAEEGRMSYDWITSDMTPPSKPPAKAAAGPADDDA